LRLEQGASRWCETGIFNQKPGEKSVVQELLDDRELAEAATLLKNAYKLGLADAFAAAIAQIKKAELVTADQEFKAVDK
jgi:predicted nucleic acid-binding protein